MGDVVQLKKKDEWDAHACLDYVKEHSNPDSQMFIVFADRSGELVWGSNGYSNHQLLWNIEEVKQNLLFGDS